MARLVGPDHATRPVYVLAGGTWRSAAGLTATVYTTQAADTLANIITYPAGDAITGSVVTVDATSRLPLFQYPDGADTVWASINGGAVVELPAVVPAVPATGGTLTGALEFGDGEEEPDVNLYRSGEAILATDSNFFIGSNLRHFGTGLGFYSAAAAAKPTVTGPRGSNAALTSLLTALATLGLITDSTS